MPVTERERLDRSTALINLVPREMNMDVLEKIACYGVGTTQNVR